MKYTMIVFIMLCSLVTFQSAVFAADSQSAGDSSIYDTIHNGKETPKSPAAQPAASGTPSLFPLFVKFIVSFILVIGLLFVLLRFLSKRSSMMQTNGPILPLGGQVLGNNRSLQVVLIGQTIYIFGVGESITLLRTISQGEEFQQILKSFENQEEMPSTKEIINDSKKMWNNVFGKHLQKIRQEHGEE
ncbi:flagellar biosynthetic protein FliO [Bacillus xiapuensis]|uniref:Flagellar biosynthetic protein FliO n=1 Tax=Bacillus xiapuensis TaxID=2014075 RepID=A0ABU6NBS3_9BACI|nr:flagellar biosynthetic protein FliO [Bacillus xiapuensis]